MIDHQTHRSQRAAIFPVSGSRAGDEAIPVLLPTSVSIDSKGVLENF